jgi:predicted transcriptional regulator of viral defense system
MKLEDFFNQNPVFRTEDVDAFLFQNGSSTPARRNALLAYHSKQGRIVNIKRSVHAVVPYGSSPENVQVDPYVLASKLTPDSVLAYHTALEFHGRNYSIFNTFQYLSKRNHPTVSFQGCDYHCIKFPLQLQRTGNKTFGVDPIERFGTEIKVTGLERTLVDVLDRPDISGSWEEIWRSLESVEFFDIDKIIDYTLLLNNSTTAAKVGLFLDQHRDTLLIEDHHLQRLYALRPKQPCYLERGKRQSGTLVPNWNVIVPDTILNQIWSQIL